MSLRSKCISRVHLRVHSREKKAPRARTSLWSAKVARRELPQIWEETMPLTIPSLKNLNVFLELLTNSKVRLVNKTQKVLQMPAQLDPRSKSKEFLATIRGQRLRIWIQNWKRRMVKCKHLTICTVVTKPTTSGPVKLGIAKFWVTEGNPMRRRNLEAHTQKIWSTQDQDQ